MMEWRRLISAKRFGMEHYAKESQENRTEFQRDFDRLVFSPPFRRLQNKTQVFPLPGSIFVHNRLTHSLEVSCVGRSLGTMVGQQLIEKYKDQQWRKLLYDLGAIVSASCLAHDLGNPPFGHSGEQAISAFFKEGPGQAFQERLTPREWADLIHFEGNANALRLLTHQFNGRRRGGFALTYSTLAAVVKYPYSSELAGTKQKFGFSLSEEESYRRIAQELGLRCLSENPLRYARHPLVFLVEAADDICYQVMDIEDSFKLKILTFEEVRSLFLAFFDPNRKSRIQEVLDSIEDQNEQVSYLRSSVIGRLVDTCAAVFIEHEESILEGTFQGSLIDFLPESVAQAYRDCTAVAYRKIYRATEVIEIEVAGHQIISTLLDRFTQAVEYPDRYYSKILLDRVPSQYEVKAPTLYGRLQAVLDYISGMTDVYALDLYRKIVGMSLPAL
jgi:dGTPase